MTATPARRRAIISDAKHPKTYKLITYTEARRAITTYLGSGLTAHGAYDTAINLIESNQALTDFDTQQKTLNLEALNNFKKTIKGLHFDGLTTKFAGQSQLKLKIAGVDVSVSPLVRLFSTLRNGDPVIGAVLVHFSKTTPLSKEAGIYVSTLMHWHLEVHYSGNEAPDPALCWAIDVPTQKIFTSTRRYSRRRSNLEAACEEITARWPLI